MAIGLPTITVVETKNKWAATWPFFVHEPQLRRAVGSFGVTSRIRIPWTSPRNAHPIPHRCQRTRCAANPQMTCFLRRTFNNTPPRPSPAGRYTRYTLSSPAATAPPPRSSALLGLATWPQHLAPNPPLKILLRLTVSPVKRTTHLNLSRCA